MALIQTGCEEVEVYQSIGRGADYRWAADLRHYRMDEAPTVDQELSWKWARCGLSPAMIREALAIARFIGGRNGNDND